MISYHMTKRLSHDDVSKYHMILRRGAGPGTDSGLELIAESDDIHE